MLSWQMVVFFHFAQLAVQNESRQIGFGIIQKDQKPVNNLLNSRTANLAKWRSKAALQLLELSIKAPT